MLLAQISRNNEHDSSYLIARRSLPIPPPVPKPGTHTTIHQEEFSYAFIGAIAAAAGYAVKLAGRTEDAAGKDLEIVAPSVTGRSYTSPVLDAQVKSTIDDSIIKKTHVLIGAPLAEVMIEHLIAIINSGSNRNELSKLMQKHQQRTASRYRRFLIALTDSEANLRIEWGSPNLQKTGNASLSVFDAWRAIEICSELVVNEPEEYEIVGTLCAVDNKRKTFRLDDIYDKKSYFGKIDSEVFKSGVEMTAIPPKNYRATIQSTIQENPTTGETSIEYNLIALEPWNKTRPGQDENGESNNQATKDISIDVASLLPQEEDPRAASTPILVN